MRSLVVVLWVLVVAVATPAHAATTCPAAPLPLTRADLPAAKVAVLAWMRADPRRAGFAARDLRGARGHAALATDPAARGLTAKRMCGPVTWRRTVVVDVYLPRVAKIGVSLGTPAYYASKTSRGWRIWFRIH